MVWIVKTNGVLYMSIKNVCKAKLMVLNCHQSLSSHSTAAIIHVYGAADGRKSV